MLNNQQYVKTIAVFIVIAALTTAGISAVAFADSHADQNEELTGNDDLTIRYSTIIGLYGDGFESDSSDEYLLEAVDLNEESYDQSTIESMTLDGNVIPSSGIALADIDTGDSTESGVSVDTGVYDRFVLPGEAGPLVDPQGEYVLREPVTGAQIQTTDQHPEAPEGVDVVADSFSLSSDKTATLTSDTSANSVSNTDYTWAVEFGPQSGITETGSNPYGSSDRTTLVNFSQYNNVATEGLDGVYELSNGAYYPGTLTFTSGTYSVIENTSAGKLTLDEGTTGIPESAEFAVEYTDVSNTAFVDENPRAGPYSEGDQITLNNDYIDISDQFPSTESFSDTSLGISVVSDKQVTATYDIVEKDATTSTTTEGANSSVGSVGTEWTVIDSQTIELSADNEVLLDTISLTDNNQGDETQLTTSDLEVIEANRGNGVRIQFPDLSGERGLSDDDRFRIEYDYVSSDDGNGNTREEVTDEVVVSYGTPISSGDIQSLTDSTAIVEVAGGSTQIGNTMSVTLNDPTLGTPDTVDLVSEGSVASGFTASGLSGSTEDIEFSTSIDQGVVQEFGTDVDGDSYLQDISPGQNPSITLGFDMTAEQEIDISYTHYQDSTLDVAETLVSSNEYGPSGLYDLGDNDPRVDEFSTMTLEGASASDFGVTVQDADNFVVGINEQSSFSSVSGSAELDQYTYSLGEERVEFTSSDGQVVVNNDGTSQLDYELQHDHTQVDHDFIVELSTEDGLKTDSLTLTSSEPTGNSLSASGTDTLVVDSTQMNRGVDYQLRVLDPSGNMIGSEVIEGGTNYNNLRLELNSGEDLSDYEDEDLTVRMMRYQALDESTGNWIPVRNEDVDTNDGSINIGDVVESTVTIDSDNGQLSFSSENEGTPLEPAFGLGWELDSEFELGDKNEEDQRVFVDRLSTEDEPNGPVNIPVGSEIVVAGNNYEPGDELILQPNDTQERTDFTVSLTVEESDTVNENQVVINTSIPEISEPGELEDRFELVEPQTGDVVFDYETTDQNLDATVNPEFVNLNTETTADLNISSDLTDYDVLVESQQLDADELMDIFPQAMIDEYQIEVEEPDNDDNEAVRIRDLNERPETISLELAGLSAQEYGLQVSAVGSGAQSTATFQTEFGSEGDADFVNAAELNDEQTFRVAEGDRVRIGIQTEETDKATLNFVDEDYDLEGIEIETDGEDATLVMDTYLADGERVNGDSVGFTDVFSVEGGEFVNTPSLPPVSGNFETGLYPMELEIENEEVDLATLVVESRETQAINTWVMPRSVEQSLDNLQNQATQQGEVAMGDTMVMEFQMTGFDSPELITDETDPAKLVNPYKRAELDDNYDTAQEFVDAEVDGVDSVVNASQVNIEVEGDQPRNRPSPHMLIDEATEVETIVEQGSENRLFLFFDLNRNTFDNFNANHNMVSLEDHLTDYELALNFSESYKYVDDNENDADLSTDFGLNERVIETRMPSTKVNETELETRWTLQSSSNATVTGETYVAPGTELSVIVRDDIENNIQESPLTIPVETSVQEKDGEYNSVTGNFDLSGLEQGREMTIQFFGINDFREPAIVGEPNVEPNAEDISVSFDGEGLRVGDEVTFTPTVQNVSPQAVSYEWDFDDGSDGSSLEAPTHAFESAGNYNVSVTVETDAGLTDTAETQVVVTEVPRTSPEIVELIAPSEPVGVGESAEFAVVARDDQVSANELIYEWDFADGTTSTGITASHAYGIADTYEVTVTVSDPESPEELQTTESVLVEVTSDQQNNNGGNNGDDNETETSQLTINALDTEAQEALPNTQITIQNAESGDQVGDTLVTDGEGQATIDLENGNYLVQASASNYENYSTGVQLSGDDTVQVDMTPTNSTGGGDDGGNNPDQPGFTLILAALGLVGAGGYIYYRRRMS